jgi:hypothetical protein
LFCTQSAKSVDDFFKEHGVAGRPVQAFTR